MESVATCGRCGKELPVIDGKAVDPGHYCVKQLKAARTILIIIPEGRGFTVQEGDRYADELCWDEMLGQIAELTHPELKRDARYRMLTAEGWRQWHERLRMSTEQYGQSEGQS